MYVVVYLVGSLWLIVGVGWVLIVGWYVFVSVVLVLVVD